MARKKPIISPLGQWAYPGEVTVIPSSKITMKGVNYPVLGVDDLGNQQMMMPGGEYDFPGNYVTEYPQMQFGGMSKRKVDKILNKNKDLNFVQRMYQPNTPSMMIPGQQYPATHFMESGDGRAYPTVVQMPDGTLQYLGDNAYDYANQTGQYIEFPNDRQARRFAKSYKKGTGVLEKFGKGGWLEEYQVGGVRAPRYTSNPNDPRIGRYRDSLNLYKKGESDYASYLKTNKRLNIPSTSTLIQNNPYVYDGDTPAKIQPIISHRYWYNHNPDVISGTNIPSKTIKEWTDRYKKPVQPYIYKKPEVSPIYTSDINDPRLASYNDSLNLYKSAKNDFNKFNKLSNNFDRDLNDEEWQRNSDRYDKLLNLQKNKWHTAEYFNDTYRPNYTANYPYKGPKSGLTIQPVGLEGFYREGYHFPRFKKPVQPYIYKPEVVPEVTETPLPVAPIEQPVKKINYIKPIIQQFNYMSIENKAKALQKYGSVGDIPYQGVNINELKDGGWLDEFQVGGRAPIYTSNPNDPRLQRFNDSASLHNSNFFIPNKDVFYRSNAELKKSFCKDINCYGLVRDGVKQNKKQKLEYIKGIQPTGYDNFPNKSDYNKGLSTEILFPEPVQPIIYQPSLAVSNIDRDMYTPGGGMAREYNIGVTLQDGNRKSFRTEKEYQDWKAANNLDISKAKVSEGRGYSYNYYPENKKYGGWLSKYQTAGEVDIVSTLKELDPNFNKPKNTANPLLKEALASADKATDMLQLGHFSTLPWAQAAGLVGDVAGISVDLAQSGIANYEGNNVNAVGNLAMASVPLLGNSLGYKRSRSLISGTSPGNYRPLSPLTPAHAANPVIAKGLGWNKALLAANIAEIASNTDSRNYTTQRVPQRDNAQVQFRPNPNRPRMAEGGWLNKYQTAGEVSPKSIGAYTNQFNEEISGLKDWYEANRKRIGDAVPEAYLRNDLKNAKKEYGPQSDPENYNPAVSDWEYDNPKVTGVRSKYNPVTNTFNERYIPPAFPFNFPELKIGLDNSKNTEESAIGIPNSYTYTNSRVKNNSFVVPYSSDYNKQLKNKGYIKDQKISVDPTAIDLYTGKNDPSTIMSHETSHYLNKNNPEVFLFNRTKLAEMGITDTEGFNNYYSTTLNNDRKEDELLSDAYALKQDMRKKGFYDYTKGEKLTPKIWNNYKKEYPDNFIIDRFTPVFENQGKNNIEELYNRNNSTEGINNIETLNDNYNITDPFSPHLKNTKETPTFKTSDERIIHLLNEIVKNKDQDLNIAKYGGWLSKYQTGGAPILSFDNDRLNKVRAFGYIPNLSDDYLQDFIPRDGSNFYNLEYQPDIKKYEPFKITKKRSLWDKIVGRYRNVTGKYNKLKDSEEFKDAQLNAEIRNTFKDYDPQFRDALNWTLDYMNSPNYKKNLMSSVKADINRNDYSTSDEEYNQVVKDRFLYKKNDRLFNLQTIPDIKPFDINIDHTGAAAWSESDTGQIRTEPRFINAEKISEYNWVNSYLYPHEISHSIDRPSNNNPDLPGEGWDDREIPKKDLKEMSSRLKIVPTSDYDKYIADPTEIRARLNATRRDFFDRGIDVFTKPINIKDVKDKNNVPSGIENLQRIYKDEDILWMLNNISKNEEPKLNIAKYGGWLNKYQTGGWDNWTPNVDKPYMRTSPAGNAGYSDNTRVKSLVIPPIKTSTGPIKQREDFEPWWDWASVEAAGGLRRQETYGNVGDLYAYYAGQPLKHNVLEHSQYKPTNSKNPKADYISINDAQFKQEVFDNYNRVFNEKKLLRDEKQLNNNTYAVSGYTRPIKEQMKKSKSGELYYEKGKDHVSNAIGHYYLSKGKDDKGDYISYYDIFDAGTGGPDGGGVGETLGLTKPFELYDRIYLDPKTGKPKLKQGGATGWLDEFQPGGYVKYVPPSQRPLTFQSSNPSTTDNTRVSGPDLNNRKAAEAAEYARKVGTITQGTPKSAYEKAREASSFVSQAERRKGSADPLDYVLDIFNPAAIGFAGIDLVDNTGSAVSNTMQGKFSEAGSDLLGAGLNALSIIPAAAEFKGIVKPLSKFARLTPGQYKVAQQFANNPEKAISQAVSYASKLAQSQIIKNPKLALSLQRGRPTNLDNVNSISGIRYGDVSSVANFNKLKPNNISEHAFFRKLEKGTASLDNSINKRVADLESEEGFRRLVEQEKAYLFDNTDTDLSVIDRIAKLNAKARIEELKNVKNVNKEATEYANTNFLGTGRPNPFVDDSYLYNNAYHRPASLYDQFVKSSGTLNLKKPTPNYSKSVPGEIGMGYNYVGNVPTEMHEIGHALQRGRILSLDNGLKNIIPKKQLKPIDQKSYKYFKKGSSGSEPTAFANELRESMFQKGFIPDYYTPINQKQIQDAYKYFKKNPMGVYDKNTGSFASSTRIFDFMEPNKANSKLLTDVLNRLPAVAPLGIGAATASQLQEQKKGGQTSWLNKYK